MPPLLYSKAQVVNLRCPFHLSFAPSLTCFSMYTSPHLVLQLGNSESKSSGTCHSLQLYMRSAPARPTWQKAAEGAPGEEGPLKGEGWPKGPRLVQGLFQPPVSALAKMIPGAGLRDDSSKGSCRLKVNRERSSGWTEALAPETSWLLIVKSPKQIPEQALISFSFTGGYTFLGGFQILETHSSLPASCP
jgi:hypothetical protein